MLAIVPTVLFRLLLPATLLISWVVRPSLISAIYGVLLLVWPFIRGPSGGFLPSTKRYLLTCVVISSLAVLAQAVFHIVLAAYQPYGSAVGKDCDALASTLQMVGLQRLNIPSALHIIRLICPDAGTWLVSIATLVVCTMYGRSVTSNRTNQQRLPSTQSAGTEQDPNAGPTSDPKPARPGPSRIGVLAALLSDVLAVALLCTAGVVLPSVLSAVYFLAFLLLMTWWAASGPLTDGCTRCVKLVLLAYSAVHMLLLYLYQTYQFQTAVDPDSLAARLLGFTAIVNSTCSEQWWDVRFAAGQRWPVFANPIVLFAFYIYVAFQTVCTYRLLASESEEPGEQSGAGQQGSPAAYRRIFSLAGREEHGAIGAVRAFIVRHSYALALITMMAWAITYHSWLSFVWLALACLIWMVTNSRKACLVLSPFILFYAEALLCLQFIYGLNLTKIELPDSFDTIPLQQIGLIKPTGVACIPLFVKTFYSIPFWIILRLWLHERRNRRDGTRPTAYGTFESAPSVSSGSGTGWIASFLVKYWIYVVGLVLLLISIRTPVVAYEVCYMAFFVVLIALLQISFRLWRAMLLLYWTILTVFSIAVLLAVYTYQFSDVPRWWYNWTHWPDETFYDLGLVRYDSASLFVQLLTPLSFLTVVILQMKFFHSAFMRLTNFSRGADRTERSTDSILNNAGATSSGHPAAPEQKSKLWETARRYYETVCDFLWRIGELHFGKLVAFWLIMLAVREVSAVNFVLVVLVCLMLPCRRLRTVFCVLATIWAALIVLTKMIYQMRFVYIETQQLDIFTKNCSDLFNGSSQKDSPAWAGFTKLKEDVTVAAYLQDYVILFVLLTFQAIILIRQKYQREALGRPTPARGVLFPDVGRAEADENIAGCFKFLANYGFYKFGLEITLIAVVIDVGVRMDAVGFLYALWLLVLVALPRRTVARVWWFFVLFVAFALALQYAVCVGLPPSACLQYPWASTLKTSLVYWLYLPSYVFSPNPYYLVGDFFVLLTASSQLYVFRIELSSQSATFEGGDNGPIPQPAKTPSAGEDGRAGNNPTPNFITYTKTYLDGLKMLVFLYFHWITLFVVFAVGVGGISGFAFGYLVAAFTLLWKGNDLYLEPHRRVMLRWYLLLFYNIFVILLKITMVVVGCVFSCGLCQPSSSWLIQLFSIACLRGPPPECMLSPSCKARPEESEIVYDAICFGFLVFQIRIFGSWYFRHSIAEFRAERILSARGAALMNLLITREMDKQKATEEQVLKGVKDATARIRDNYLAQVNEQKTFEPNNYADRSSCPMLRSFNESLHSALNQSDSYAAAKRAGDYYMFNDEYEKERSFETEPLAPETTPGADVERIGPTQLLHIAGQQDLQIDDIITEAKRLDAEIKAEQGPGASKEVDVSEVKLDVDEEAKEEQPEGKLKKIRKFIGMFLGSILNRLTFTFNRWSRDYRYVAYVMKGEKQRLKERLMNEMESEDDFRRVRETIFNNDISSEVQQVHTVADIEATKGNADQVEAQHNAVARFLIATFYLLASHTELLCYLMIVLDQMGNAAIISMPLPFLAFFWGTLCSPRPPKFFWVTIITYTEAMIVVKFMFQFGFWHWGSSNQMDPFYTPKILGIERKDYYAAYDVALLMVLFFHRYVLKRLGLWKDVSVEKTDGEPSALDEEDQLRDQGKADTFELQELPSRENEDSQNPNKNSNGAQEDRDGDEDKTKAVGASGRMAYCSCFIEFYQRLLHPAVRYIMDLYSFMFLCDLICFLILVFGYSSFGVARGEEGVVSDIASNRVPLPFVLMLITLMVLIIIDRAIYLRKSVVGKLIFQYLLVTAMHLWIFFGLPAFTDRSITRNVPAQLFYFFKCVYFILSAWQIRNSYPSRIQGNLLTKRFGMTNYVLFTGFMALPFLFELRTLIDWVWTDTSMPLFDYFNMENIYACVFRSKCMRKFEKEYPVARGVPKAMLVKYGMGIPILILIVVLLWLPLLLFALVNAIGERLPVEHAQFSVNIEGYPPLYAMEAQRSSLRPVTTSEAGELRNLFNGSRAPLDFLNDFTELDTYKADFRGGASKYWTITDQSREALRADLDNGTLDVHINFEWEFRRRDTGKGQGRVQSGSNSTTLKKDDPIRTALLDMIPSPAENVAPGEEWVRVPYAIPPFLLLPSVGSASPANTLLYTEPKSAGLRLRLRLERGSFLFWELAMDTPPWMASYPVPPDSVQMTVFVDRVFPSALDSFINGGIIGLYIAVVLVAGRMIRAAVVSSPTDVMLTEMPDVDRIVQLCQNVFLVREARDFILELDLFAKLVFLFRSPETLIRWTRPKLE